MPVSIVIGGQFGSEGKGKVALEIVRRDSTVGAVVRVGGTNSGHTGIGRDGKIHALRQLPAAAIDGRVQIVLPPGSFIDVELLHAELAELGLNPNSVAISPMARVITNEDKIWEAASGLGSAIGSTQSGTGGAVLAMTAREAAGFPLRSVQAEHVDALRPFLRDTTELMRTLISAGSRIVIEGTQGFGLSLLQGGYWPKATSRDTTAAGFLAEAGLSPRDVDDVTMVIRCHPIRVAGDSGPLVGETTWDNISHEAGSTEDLREFTTVTHKLRRVGRFDPDLVRHAIQVNRPDRIVLNHVDYIDPEVRTGALTKKAADFVAGIESAIGQEVQWIGTGPVRFIERHSVDA